MKKMLLMAVCMGILSQSTPLFGLVYNYNPEWIEEYKDVYEEDRTNFRLYHAGKPSGIKFMPPFVSDDELKQLDEILKTDIELKRDLSIWIEKFIKDTSAENLNLKLRDLEKLDNQEKMYGYYEDLVDLYNEGVGKYEKYDKLVAVPSRKRLNKLSSQLGRKQMTPEEKFLNEFFNALEELGEYTDALFEKMEQAKFAALKKKKKSLKYKLRSQLKKVL